MTAEHPSFDKPSSILRAGRVYTVTRVGRFHDWFGDRALALVEATPLRGPDYGFPSAMFRKIEPHTPDAEDEETIRLLNGQSVPVEARLAAALYTQREGL